MFSTLAQAQTVYLLSIYKPILMAVVFGAWGWAVARLDKDLKYFYLARSMWNGIQMAAGGLALFLWLMIPYFWLGMPAALLVMSGTIFAYVVYRNQKVPASARWTPETIGQVFSQRMEAMQHAQAQKQATLKLLRRDLSAMDVPTPEMPEHAAHLKLEEWMDFALARGAERLDLVIAPQQAAAVVHVDGVKYAQPALEPKAAMTVVRYLKEHSGLDVEDLRKRQSGELKIGAGEYGTHNLRVITAGSTREVTLTLSIDPEKRQMLKLGELGLLESQRQALVPVLAQNRGVVLVACPPHHGMTTTLYSLLNTHDPYTQSLVTLEEEIAFEIEGVTHETIATGADADALSKRVAAVLRTDPNAFLLSRLSDTQTARVVAQGSATCRFYLGLRQDDTFAAAKTWIKAVGDIQSASQSLLAVVSQRLVRKLCPTCRVPYKPDPAMLKKLNLSAERVAQFYKHSGKVMVKDKEQPCPACLGMAYRGRTAVYEVMVLDDPARQMLAQNLYDQLRAHLRKQKMLWLQEAALAKVVEGLTSISEVTRVMSEAAGKGE